MLSHQVSLRRGSREVLGGRVYLLASAVEQQRMQQPSQRLLKGIEHFSMIRERAGQKVAGLYFTYFCPKLNTSDS